jgi:hypothetical protein
MEQDLPHAVCGDLLLIAMLLSMFELASVSGFFWSIATDFSSGSNVPG